MIEDISLATQRSLRGLVGVQSAVRLLNEIMPAFRYDLRSDMKDLAVDIHRASQGNPPLEDFDDHLKSAIRSLFGEIEALTHSLAAAVLGDGNKSVFPISNADRAVLEERDYDPETDLLSNDSRRYPLVARFEAASRLFFNICGVDQVEPWPQEILQHFKDLARARNRLTHPTRIEHLFVTPAFEDFRQITIWFPSYAVRVLAAASRRLGLPEPEAPPILPVPPLPVSIPKAEQVFDKGFYDLVFSDPSTAIRYIGFFSKKLDDEVIRAFNYSREALSPPYEPDQIGRAVRRMIRAIATNVEGMIEFTSFFMRAVRRSKAKVAYPPQIKGETVPERSIRVLAAFSHAFGADALPERNESWDALCATLNTRDKLTHPRSANDVFLGVDTLNLAMKALDWLFKQAHPATLLGKDKIADCFGSRRSSAQVRRNSDATNR